MASANNTGVRVAMAPSLRALHRSVVTVSVGKEKHPFVIHKERLCHYSSYFKTLLTGINAGSKGAELLSQDREVFEQVEHWLYTQKLQQVGTEEVDLALSDMVRVYVFAFRYGMPLLRDAVVDTVAANESTEAGLAEPKDIQYLCENTPPGCPLQRLLVAMIAFGASTEWFEHRMDDLPKVFTAQIALLNITRLPRRLPNELAPFELDICQYHEHSATTETCSTKRNKTNKRKRDSVD